VSTIHPTGVAGFFYPAGPDELTAGVDASLGRAAEFPLTPKAVIAPHAGHIYSGDIAGSAYRLLSRRRGEIRRVILMGPNHRVPLRGLAVSPADAWATPLGPLAVDKAAREVLAKKAYVVVSAAPFAQEHSLEVHLPFIHRALGAVEILPILVGQTPPEQVSDALDLLWGGPETAIIISSDLSHFLDYESCRTKDAQTTAAIERLQSAAISDDVACGRFAIHGLIQQARKRDLRVTALDVRNSGDTRGMKTRTVGYGAYAFEYAHSARLDAATRQSLLGMTRKIMQHGLANQGEPLRVNYQGEMPRLMQAQRATFVTITINGQLRGCRGSTIPHRSLIQDVVENAQQAAFGDPRFSKLTQEEHARSHIEVSILSTPRRIPCASEAELAKALRPDIDGLILRDGDRRSLFLPTVWATLPEPLAFIRHLKRKAEMPADHWSPTMEAYRFTTECFGEEKGHA
jgi:AmmeMemoRadiSam system protein B/AmmeMemoRadiSam system protein A